MVKISVVIVSWNAKNYLMECLESLFSRKESNVMEIIVVDNASTDGSPEAVSGQFPTVKLIQNITNLGFGKANNIGIENSIGDYICLINSDVTVLDNCIKQLFDYMENNLSIGIVGPQILNGDQSLQCSCRHFPSLWNNFCSAFGLNNIFQNSKICSGEQMYYFHHDRIERVQVISGCFMMVRRKALEQVGYLDNQFFMYSEDVDWCKRFWDNGWEAIFFPDAQAIHYGGASASNAPIRFSVEQEKALLQYWAKHHRKPAQLMIFIIIFLKHFVRLISGSVLYLIKSSDRLKLSAYIDEHITCIRALIHHCCSF